MTPEIRNQIARDVIRDVAKTYDIGALDLQSRRRGVALEAKAEVAKRLRDLALSFPQIGEAMNCHHTTAMDRAKR